MHSKICFSKKTSIVTLVVIAIILAFIQISQTLLSTKQSYSSKAAARRAPKLKPQPMAGGNEAPQESGLILHQLW